MSIRVTIYPNSIFYSTLDRENRTATPEDDRFLLFILTFPLLKDENYSFYDY